MERENSFLYDREHEVNESFSIGLHSSKMAKKLRWLKFKFNAGSFLSSSIYLSLSSKTAIDLTNEINCLCFDGLILMYY